MFDLSALQPLTAPRLWYTLWWSAWAVVLAVSLLPMPQVGLDVSHGDKWLHVLAHGALAAYAWSLFRPGAARWTALLGLVGLGLLIEGLQALLPWRSAEGWDLLANLVGTVLGSLVSAGPLAGVLLRLDRRLFAHGSISK